MALRIALILLILTGITATLMPLQAIASSPPPCAGTVDPQTLTCNGEPVPQPPPPRPGEPTCCMPTSGTPQPIPPDAPTLPTAPQPQPTEPQPPFTYPPPNQPAPTEPKQPTGSYTPGAIVATRHNTVRFTLSCPVANCHSAAYSIRRARKGCKVTGTTSRCGVGSALAYSAYVQSGSTRLVRGEFRRYALPKKSRRSGSLAVVVRINSQGGIQRDYIVKLRLEKGRA